MCLLCSVSSGSLECSAEKDFEAVSGLSEKEFSGGLAMDFAKKESGNSHLESECMSV